MLIKSDPVRGRYFFIFLTLFGALFDDYIENIGIKYGIIKGIFERSVAWIFTH